MSETPSENPNQVTQPGAEEQHLPEDTPTPTPQPQPTTTNEDEQTFPIRLVKRPTGDRHWNTAAGIWETVTHGETGEPSMQYELLATIDGVDVPLAYYNAGRLETIVRAQQQAQQSSGA